MLNATRGLLKERQRMATLLQFAVPAYHRTTRVRVSFGAPIAGGSRDLHAAVIDAMRALIGAP